MTRTPTISIITLTRNRAGLLEENLRSLCGQLGSSDEIVIIDNGSTDTTTEVIRRYSRNLSIRTYTHIGGSYPALYNYGIRHAKNPILVFLDDDCIADPHYIARIRSAHQRHPDEAIQGRTVSIPEGNIYAGIMGDHYNAFIRANMTDTVHIRILDNKNAAIPRSVLKRFGGFSDAMSRGSEDIELGIRLRANGIPIRYEPSVIAYHHERTTFSGFIRQHLRFARSEKILDTIVPSTERVGLVRFSKLSLQLTAAYRREIGYLKQGAIGNAMLLPILYILLACIRVWGYALSR